MRGLKDKVAVVTGGKGLIGSAVNLRLAEEGAIVGVGSRSLEGAEAWCAEQAPADGKLVPLQLDVGDSTSIDAAFERMEELAGKVTILVATAVPLEALPVPFDEMSHEHFSRLMEVDVAGNFIAARTLVDRLDGGTSASIVLFSSIYGSAAVDQGIYPEGMMHSPVHYAASKAAVQGVTRYLASMWGPRGVRANAVVSGGVRSKARQNDEFVARYAAKTMLGRMAEPEEVAAAAVFLASQDASYITGTCVDVEGGFLAW